MIAFIANRPALQIGRHQVFDYDTSCLEEALRRAARAADQEDFPFVHDIHSGVVKYLETKCTLRLLTLNDRYERVRKMLMKIGCVKIADELKPLAPPLTLSLVESANEAGNGFELAFFERLRAEISELRVAGVEKMVVADLEQIGGTGITGDVAAELAVGAVGFGHHGQRVPAHQRREPLLDGQVEIGRASCRERV